MEPLERANLLILQGQELCDEVQIFVTGGPQPKADWKEVKEWHNEVYAVVAAISPTLRERLKPLSVDQNRDEIFAVIRNDLLLLKACQESHPKPERSITAFRSIAT